MSSVTEQVKYTPTQLRMLAILSDGMRHTKEELHACLEDDLGPVTNIRAHLTFLRKKLRPKGEEIICELVWRSVYYRHVRLLAPASAE